MVRFMEEPTMDMEAQEAQIGLLASKKAKAAAEREAAAKQRESRASPNLKSPITTQTR
jgi:hypothetical protein